MREGYWACPSRQPDTGKAIAPVPEMRSKQTRGPYPCTAAMTQEGAVVPVF